MSDYVFPNRKLFPINKPEDILKAIESYHIFKDDIQYEEFAFRLAKLAQYKGYDFVKVLPLKLKKIIGFKENKPESERFTTSKKKKKSRFIKKEYEE